MHSRQKGRPLFLQADDLTYRAGRRPNSGGWGFLTFTVERETRGRSNNNDNITKGGDSFSTDDVATQSDDESNSRDRGGERKMGNGGEVGEDHMVKSKHVLRGERSSIFQVSDSDKDNANGNRDNDKDIGSGNNDNDNKPSSDREEFGDGLEDRSGDENHSSSSITTSSSDGDNISSSSSSSSNSRSSGDYSVSGSYSGYEDSIEYSSSSYYYDSSCSDEEMDPDLTPEVIEAVGQTVRKLTSARGERLQAYFAALDTNREGNLLRRVSFPDQKNLRRNS